MDENREDIIYLIKKTPIKYKLLNSDAKNCFGNSYCIIQ